MDKDILKGQWKQLEGKIQQQWGKLTSDDLSMAKGDRDVLVGRIQERYGRAKDEARMELDTWLQAQGVR